MTVEKIENESRYLWAYIVAAYLFSIAMRYIWVQWAGQHPEFFWNGQLMINTNDGYFFASGAQKELYGTLGHNPRVPGIFEFGVVYLTYLAAKFLPFSLDTVILYMPSVVASLVVIPVILIGRLYRMTFPAFLAALLAAIVWSYYNRTMTGYYDTDMFSAMAPMFIVYFMLAAIKTHKSRYAFFAALALALYPFLYDQGKAMMFAISLLYIGYVWLFHRKEKFAMPSIALVAAAMLPLFWPWKIVSVLVVYALLKSNRLDERKQRYLAFGLTLIFLLLGDGFFFIYTKISWYLSRNVEGSGLKFFQVIQTVREAGQIPFELLAKRIAGSVPGFLFALIGYLLLLWRERAFVITLPLMGLGLFALWGGLRFTVYAVPIAAISLIYLFYVVSQYIANEKMRIAFLVATSIAALYPNVVHIVDYKVPTVFDKREVEVLDRLKKVGSEKDYVIAWWDYGYPIWYYADKNTLIDGGKHEHDNFIVSEILTTDSQLEAARLSRIAVETYIQSNYAIVADTIFKNGRPDQIDPNEYLQDLKAPTTKIDIPKKSREIYIYLPWRMNAIYPTVRVFSNIDLLTGERGEKPLFLATRLAKNEKDTMRFGNGVLLKKSEGVLMFGNRKIPIKSFVTSQLRPDGTMDVKAQNLYAESDVSVLFAKDYGTFFILDERMLKSLYVQLFFLQNYNPELFEPVVLTPWTKIYRVLL